MAAGRAGAGAARLLAPAGREGRKDGGMEAAAALLLPARVPRATGGRGRAGAEPLLPHSVTARGRRPQARGPGGTGGGTG